LGLVGGFLGDIVFGGGDDEEGEARGFFAVDVAGDLGAEEGRAAVEAGLDGGEVAGEVVGGRGEANEEVGVALDGEDFEDAEVLEVEVIELGEEGEVNGLLDLGAELGLLAGGASRVIV
jgi:hypothetical protein